MHHHAYVIPAPREHGLLEARSLTQLVLVGELAGHPDLFLEEFELLTVDDARELRERASRRPVAGERKAFIVAFDAITIEAQNALLKLLEEPPYGTHFFLVVPSAEMLLPTLRSRLEEVTVHGVPHTISPWAREFLNASPADRLLMVGKIVAGKDKARAKALLDSLTLLLHEDIMKDPENTGLTEALTAIMTARSYLGDRSPSLKMLLEHIALCVPRRA